MGKQLGALLTRTLDQGYDSILVAMRVQNLSNVRVSKAPDSLAARPLRVVGHYAVARLSRATSARGEGLANLALD